MLKKLLMKFGAITLTVALTILSILISILITASLTMILSGEVSVFSLIIATIVPAAITPFFAYITLRLTHQVHIAEERLRQLSITDELTNSYNRRFFIETAEKALAAVRRYGGSFSIILLDVDDFKQINDTHGHAAGDKVLVAASEICSAAIRSSDLFARYGGEEFAILVHSCSPANIEKFMERIRLRLSESRVLFNSNHIGFTVSMGAATYNDETPNIDALLMRADAALYTAKRQGKNRVILA